MTDRYEPELGQAAFGNRYEEHSLGDSERLVGTELYSLSEELGKRNPDAQSHGFLGGEWGYGQEFANEVFSMRPYYWGDCLCDDDEHAPGCPVVIPNFRCGDVEVYWYKYIGRGMSANRKVERGEWRDIFSRCFASLDSP